jgi:spermidine synthase
VLAAHGAPQRVLVMGGGDGLAVREILKYPGVKEVVLVELDPQITQMFSRLPMLTRLNAGALKDPRVRIVNADAYQWLETQAGTGFDIVIADFPDPSNHALAKLYSTSFYQRVREHLSASGFLVVQSTSPLIARASFWTVAETLEAVGLRTVPYHVNVPSFGEWGFVIASTRPWSAPARYPEGLRFLTPAVMQTALNFPPDMDRVDEAGVNRLSDPVLVQHFLREWGSVQ